MSEVIGNRDDRDFEDAPVKDLASPRISQHPHNAGGYRQTEKSVKRQQMSGGTFRIVIAAVELFVSEELEHGAVEAAETARRVTAVNDRLEERRMPLQEALGDAYKVKDDHCFSGFDAYKNVIDSDVEVDTKVHGKRAAYAKRKYGTPSLSR